jgi:hypothetical protein
VTPILHRFVDKRADVYHRHIGHQISVRWLVTISRPREEGKDEGANRRSRESLCILIERTWSDIERKKGLRDVHLGSILVVSF